jgi:methionyl-tRNA synthetase
MKTVFISTAIDYVNASPHLGHAMEKIQADVIARYHRSLGDEVFFLSGTDENSLKNVQSADKEGMPVKDLVDKYYEKFHGLKQALNLSYDDFIRTTEERHVKGAQKLWQQCGKDIYQKKYRGLYCVGCEEFYKEQELENGLCPEHKKPLELVEEENYFFKLAQYQEKLKELISKGKIRIVPETKKNEILSFIDSGLEDFCISRSSNRAKGWGIDVPNDPSQKIWVWFDALANYITALGYGSGEESKFNHFWQSSENKLHVIGKGITRFHAVYWPAMLLSANISLPRTIFVHGYITANGQKMSKSIGNVVDPFELVNKYGTDAVRYFLLREIPALGDGDFTYEKFEKRYNDDLASGLGNLFSRVMAMVEKQGELKIQPNEFTLKEVEETKEKCREKIVCFSEALAIVWELISSCDKYIDREKPWEIKDEEKKKEVFSNLLFSLKNIGEMIHPFMPGTAEKMKEQLGEEEGVFRVKKGQALFPRI